MPIKGNFKNVSSTCDLEDVVCQARSAASPRIMVRAPTKRRFREAASAGFYEPKEFPGRYPRLQILTIAELLAGKKLEYPAHRVETFAKAERKTKHEQEQLF